MTEEYVEDKESEKVHGHVDKPVIPVQQILHKLDTAYLNPGMDTFYYEYRDYTPVYEYLLGKGVFSLCIMATDVTSKSAFAIKQNKLQDEKKVDYIRRECKIMASLPHNDHVIRFLGAVLDYYPDESYSICRLMMEVAENGNLSDLLRDENYEPSPLPLEQSLYYVQQILVGVHFLHCNNVLHLDIKGDNILLLDGGRTVKIGGFGRAVLFDYTNAIELSPRLESAIPGFCAPEVVRQEIPSTSADIWSVMCVLVLMLTGRMPGCFKYHITQRNQVIMLVGRYEDSQIDSLVPHIDELDPDIAKIFQMVFRKDPKVRPSALELLNVPKISEAHEYEKYFETYEEEEEAEEDSERHFVAVKQAMKRKGTLDHTILQAVYLGPARSGKSSLIKRLTGEGPCSCSPSTGVAEEPVHIQVQQSYSIPLSVSDSVWFKLTYNTEAVELMLRISHFFSSSEASGASGSSSKQVHATRPRLYSSDLEPSTPTLVESVDIGVKSQSSSTHAQEMQSNQSNVPLSLPEGYKSPLEILRAAASGQDVSSYLENSWSLYLTDTGGQMEFQDLLPLLVSGPSVFFITFRLNQDLNKAFTIQYELPDGNKSEPYESTLTLMEAILQSLASISSMGTFVYKGLQKQQVPIRPKAFFVGTHKDMLDPATADHQIHKVDRYLQKVIKSTSHYRDGLIEFASPNQLIFTVNNLAQEDADFQKIRSAVEQLIQRGEFKIHSPSHWLIFSLVIRYLKSRIISFEECLSVACQCGIKDEAELKEALRFLHTKLGVVRYFPVEGLDSIVVKDPQLLFDKVTELIVRTFTFENVGKYSTDEFKKKGIFSLGDFERISGDSNSLLTPTLLVKLLQHLRIVAPFQTEDGDTKYFIPCVLSHTGASETSSLNQHLEIPQLVVTFKCGYCPKGVSGALIKYLLTNEMQSELEWILQLDEIFRDQVSMLVGPDFDTVVLTILPTNIKIMFVPNAQSIDRDCSAEEICDEVRSAVEKGIIKVTFDMNYLCYAKHTITFECPCDISCSDPHAAQMSWYKGKPSKLLCNQTKKCFPLPSGCMVWFGRPLSTGRSTYPSVNTMISPTPIPMQPSTLSMYPNTTPMHQTVHPMYPATHPLQHSATYFTEHLSTHAIHPTMHPIHPGSYPTDTAPTLVMDPATLSRHPPTHFMETSTHPVNTSVHFQPPYMSQTHMYSPPEHSDQMQASANPSIGATRLNELFRLMLPLASEWHNIGVLLNVSNGVLKTIGEDCRKSNDCLREMLSSWLQQVHNSPTWKTVLAEAIEPFDPRVSQIIKKLQ